MTSFTEGIHAGEFVLSEGNGTISRDKVTIAAGEDVLPAGRVLGKITADDKWVSWSPDASDGSQNAKGILYDRVDATDDDVEATIIARFAEVKRDALSLKTATVELDLDDALASLAAAGIIVRD